MWPLLLTRTWKEVWGTSCLWVSFRLMAPASIYTRLQEGKLILTACFLPIVEILTNKDYSIQVPFVTFHHLIKGTNVLHTLLWSEWNQKEKEGHMHLDDSDALNIVMQLKFNEASSFCSATALSVHVAVHTLFIHFLRCSELLAKSSATGVYF